MKTKKIERKMTLNKMTIADLSDATLNQIKGGTHTSTDPECYCDSVRWCTCPYRCPWI